MQTGIEESIEFVKKKLANFAVNVGLKCGHACTYCSSSSLYRTHPIFKEIGKTAFEQGFCVVDPGIAERISQDLHILNENDTVMVCTLSDAWAPESKKYDLGRQILEGLLKTKCKVRILTKNASVAEDLDIIQEFGGRVSFGISLTATRAKEEIISAIEPNASSISERISVIKKAHRLGIPVFGMLCPLLPGISDDKKSIKELLRIVNDAGAQEAWLEPVNPRGNGLILTEEALSKAGYKEESRLVCEVRHNKSWVKYTENLVNNINEAIDEMDITGHVLLYKSSFRSNKLPRFKGKADIIWLVKVE